jgi:hypothetical protein
MTPSSSSCSTSSSYQYSAIHPPSASQNDSPRHDLALPEEKPWTRRSVMLAVVTALGMSTLSLTLISIARQDQQPIATTAMNMEFTGASHRPSYTAKHVTSKADAHPFPMPAGVNVGSWLSLEDYFYVGPTGAVEVATSDSQHAAVCLPPLYTGQRGSPASWQSETDLLASLMETSGLAHALKVFQAHRTTYITEDDVAKLAAWGVQHIRVPLSWCFTDANPDDIDLKNTSHAYYKELMDRFTCEDPFYMDKLVRWPAIPRSILARFLRNCATYGITASLDLHTYPGATSPGTFSGLWPRHPRFWLHDQPENPQEDLGRLLYRDFVEWVTDLATTDPQAFDGILGISPMNEPAHLAGIFRDSDRDYLPALSVPMAATYLQDELDSDANVPNGPHLRVFKWMSDAIQVFRESPLPAAGKQLHVNIHESVLSAQVLSDPNDGANGGGLHPSANNLIAAWWSHVTTRKERKAWAVLDMHHYHAWEPACTGASDGPPVGNYSCSNVGARDDALRRCTLWAHGFREAVDTRCGTGALLMSGEFSTSTHHKVKHACNDVDTLKASYQAQLAASESARVKLYYWSYRMPFGGSFRSAWSFSHLMYRLGVNPHPDESNYPCGDPSRLHANEVTDDFFPPGSS